MGALYPRPDFYPRPASGLDRMNPEGGLRTAPPKECFGSWQHPITPTGQLQMNIGCRPMNSSYPGMNTWRGQRVFGHSPFNLSTERLTEVVEAERC